MAPAAATTTMAEQAVLALGAWLKNTACLLPLQPGAAPRWSLLHGDLGDPQACAALQDSVAALQAGGTRIAAVAHDLHPDFFSTRLAQQLAADLGVPAVGVQHHQGHIAAVLAEHGVQQPDLGDQPVIGLALDGFGLGPAGEAWGGELLWLQGARWQRLGGLWPLALPGGDAAAREPWRMAAAALHALGRGDQIVPRLGPPAGALKAGGVAQMLRQGLNCPPTSSAGRWFDAAAGALGLSVRQAHEAEAAIALEQAAQRALARRPAHALAPPPGLVDVAATGPLDIRPLLLPLLDLAPGVSAAAVDDAAAGFHLGLADALVGWAAHAAARHGTRCVALGGGCFANQVLTQRLQQQLQQRDLQVLRPQALSCGDAGLALGQAWVAAQQLRLTDHHDQSLPEATCA
jgi:hydrogenase maturation protein HypF